MSTPLPAVDGYQYVTPFHGSWDLATIPDELLFAEAGRRAKLKQKTERGGAPKGNRNAAAKIKSGDLVYHRTRKHQGVFKGKVGTSDAMVEFDGEEYQVTYSLLDRVASPCGEVVSR